MSLQSASVEADRPSEEFADCFAPMLSISGARFVVTMYCGSLINRWLAMNSGVACPRRGGVRAASLCARALVLAIVSCGSAASMPAHAEIGAPTDESDQTKAITRVLLVSQLTVMAYLLEIHSACDTPQSVAVTSNTEAALIFGMRALMAVPQIALEDPDAMQLMPIVVNGAKKFWIERPPDQRLAPIVKFLEMQCETFTSCDPGTITFR